MASQILGILITPITEIGKYLLVLLKTQVGYVLTYPKNVSTLKTLEDDLMKTIDSVENSIYESRRRGEIVDESIEKWVENAEKIMDDVHKIVENSDKEKKENCCANLTWRYVMSKKAAKKVRDLRELKADVKLIQVCRSEPLPSIEMIPTGEFKAFESTQMAMTKIIEALDQGNTKIIGVYGMGGVGKTSLMKQVAKQAKQMNMFDEIVIATVSQNPDLKKTQSEIAEGLGFKLSGQSEPIRAMRLAKRLKLESRILIILDDVWDRVELDQMGIPLGEQDQSNCKIAITTRSLDVCSEMDCDVSIMVDVLSEQDSWDLFKKVAGSNVESRDLHLVAKAVAKECGGLPIALVTIARILRNKEQNIWLDAAEELKKSKPVNIQGMHEKVFSCLQLSFDHVRSEGAKLCFLYSSLFPEEYDVRVEDIVRYGFGEGLFSDVDTVDEARKRVHAIISNLKASCLLMSSNTEGSVKMHDVFRDLAITIATSDDYCFMVKASSGLKEWPRRLKLEYVMRMSLINNEFSILRGQRAYPELLLLLLQNNRRLSVIQDEFFAGMRALQVLDLSSIPNIVLLPPSLSCLTNLKTLCIENDHFEDLSVLGSLTSLEILSLQKSSFSKFPEEIARLTNMRLLDLTESRMETIPRNVISSLVHLEELYMEKSYSCWELRESESEDKALLAEIFSLENLNTLSLHISNCNCLYEEVIDHLQNLKKFRIQIGEEFEMQTMNATSLCFHIPGRFKTPNPVTGWTKNLLERTEKLSLVKWMSLSDLERMQAEDFLCVKSLSIQECGILRCFSSTMSERLNGLLELEIISCSKLEIVFVAHENDPPRSVLLGLERMHIQDLPKLTSIWKGSVSSTCLQNLKHVKIEFCGRLKILFPLALAKSLTQLKSLEVSHCESMETLICDEVEDRAFQGRMSLQSIENSARVLFPQLQTINLNHLQNLRSVIEPRFSFEFPSLEEITVISCSRLKVLPHGPKSLPRLNKLNAERKWFEELEIQDEETKLH